jgi:hypothetical protein
MKTMMMIMLITMMTYLSMLLYLHVSNDFDDYLGYSGEGVINADDDNS